MRLIRDQEIEISRYFSVWIFVSYSPDTYLSFFCISNPAWCLLVFGPLVSSVRENRGVLGGLFAVLVLTDFYLSA